LAEGGRPGGRGRRTARAPRPRARLLALQELDPRRERPGGEALLELGGQRVLVGVALARRERGPAGELAQPREEARLERGDGEVAAVGGAVDPVAGEAPRERPAERGELAGDVGERDREPGTAARALALEQR